MSNYEEMLKYQNILMKNNIPCLVPENEGELIKQLSRDEFNEFKRKVSKKHFEEIINNNVFAILVVNPTKNYIPNYIGANTFAEIAIAFYKQRQIFLLYDIYEGFKDELIAWDIKPLQGNINSLIEEYNSSIYCKDSGEEILTNRMVEVK
ncbi:hypothetical protein [Nostoc sp.]|uniref:hypothetical protein n=1 Tax=Nostoc sp. TaxID=1180 RepID=UPI002FFB78E6